MTIKNKDLEITRTELIDMIENDNPDRNDWSKDKLINILTKYKFPSTKQHNWILSKVKYIVNHNSKYSNFKKKFVSINIQN
jgi:hypothetical protein